jgi:hypothetical protein
MDEWMVIINGSAYLFDCEKDARDWYERHKKYDYKFHLYLTKVIEVDKD